MSDDATDRVAAFFTAPENHSLVFDWLAEVGGDPDQYGFDEIPETEAQIADSLKTFVQTFGVHGLVAPEIAALADSSDVDWIEVTRMIDATFTEGPVNL